MKVAVRFESQLRLKSGHDSVEIETDPKSSVAAVLQQVAEQLDDRSREHLLQSDGSVRGSLLLFVNDQPVRNRDAGSVRASDGDVISVVPPIAGG